MAAMSAEQLAQRFHEHYERLAPEHGYKTREASAMPWEDVPEANKSLMIAVAGEVLRDLQQPRQFGSIEEMRAEPIEPEDPSAAPRTLTVSELLTIVHPDWSDKQIAEERARMVGETPPDVDPGRC